MWKIGRSLGRGRPVGASGPRSRRRGRQVAGSDRARRSRPKAALDNLKKFKANVSKDKGKFYGQGEGIDYTGESSIQLPDRYRLEVKFKAGGQDFTFIQVIAGDKGWIQDRRHRPQEMDKDMLAEAKEQMNAR